MSGQVEEQEKLKPMTCEACGSLNIVIQGGHCTTCMDCGVSSCAVA